MLRASSLRSLGSYRSFRLSWLAIVAASMACAASGVACGSSDGGSDGANEVADGGPGSGGDAGPGGEDGGAGGDALDPTVGCPRAPAPADRPRKVVASHPFGADAGVKAKEFEVLDLSADGTLSRPAPPVTFTMGTALDAPIVFTPDGEIGVVAQDDGSVGIFRLPAGGGAPVVIDPKFDAGGAFYARAVVMAKDGSRAWVLDQNTADNGGGVYEIALACDGTPTSRGLVVPGSGASAMALLPGDPKKAVLAAKKAFDAPDGRDVHLVDLAGRSSLGSAAPFGDADAIASSVAVMPDGKYALVADDGIVTGSRLAVVALTPALAPVSVLSTPFPAAVVASPFGNAAIVLNDDSTDEIHVLSYDPSNTAAPFAITGEVAYAFGKPQIPVTASTIDRGSLEGTVFVGENVAVRQLRFGPAGDVTDVAKLASPPGLTGIVGVVGVQP